MLEAILSLMISLALVQSGVQSEPAFREVKNTIPFESNVVQIVKAEKGEVVTKEMVEEEKWEIYNISAYTNGYESTQKRKGQKGYAIQANGEKTIEGKSIACPKSLEFGTKVKIKELNNTYICSDRGAAITEGKLDIFFEDLKEALEFGRQFLHVQIIKKEVD